MIKGVIFDMDGVLVDNRDVHIEAFVIFAKKHGMETSAEKILPLFGMGNDEIMPRLFGSHLTEEQINSYAEEKEEIYREIFAKTIKPHTGLVELLGELKAGGYKVAVGSSGMEKNVKMVLELCRISQYFDAIAHGDLVKAAKPDPEIFLLAASLMGLKGDECLVFEDSFAGIEAARAAKSKVVAVATTFKREAHSDYDAIIDDFTQFDRKLLKSL